jgi:hypothetical protein
MERIVQAMRWLGRMLSIILSPLALIARGLIWLVGFVFGRFTWQKEVRG